MRINNNVNDDLDDKARLLTHFNRILKSGLGSPFPFKKTLASYVGFKNTGTSKGLAKAGRWQPYLSPFLITFLRNFCRLGMTEP